jgi:hypothetical protein
MLAILEPARFLFLLPLCLSIALVTSAARHDDLRGVFRHALRSFTTTLLGILIFMAALSWFFEWVLPR